MFTVRNLMMILALTLMTACGAMHTLTADTMPRRGWTTAQVQAALGLSIDTSTSMDPPIQIWRYGVSPAGFGLGPLGVLPRCDSLSNTCLSVIFREGRVVNVRSQHY